MKSIECKLTVPRFRACFHGTMSENIHMTNEEFRSRAHQVVDWVADYLDQIERLPIVPDLKPGDIMALLPEHAPEEPEPFDAIFSDLDRVVKPGLTGWQHPGWFAFFPGNISPPAILAEMVASGLGQQGMLWSTSPVSTEVEMRVMDWLVEMLDLPSAWKMAGPGGGVIQTTASDSTHTAIVVARHVKSESAAVDSLVAYTSEQSHSSVEKGARVAGFRHTRTVGVDRDFAMDPGQLEEAIAADLAGGLVPAFVCSTVGTTGTTAVDPVEAIGTIARRHGMWHHVDAAFAGSAMICPEFRHHQPGLELVDSYVFNPHKWLLTNVDCSVMFVADRAPLLATMSILPALSARSGGRVHDGGRLSRLACGTRAQVSRPETVVGTACLRGAGSPVDDPRARRAGARTRPESDRSRATRDGRPRAVLAGLFPTRRWRRSHHPPGESDQRVGPLVCHPIGHRREVVHTGFHRPDLDQAVPRRPAVASDYDGGLGTRFEA